MKIPNWSDALKNSGVRAAIDNFTRDSGLVDMLFELPLDMIKISRRHVSDVIDNINDQNFVTNIVNIAAMTDAHVGAEGVEKKEQEQELLALGVEYLQGYYYSKPVTAREFEDIVRVSNSIDM